MNIEDPKGLQDYRRTIFGSNVGGETMPPTFLATVRRTIARAEHVLTLRHSATKRQVFWLEGRSLGVLSSTGSTDEDANIDGRVIQLGTLTKIQIDVPVEYRVDGFDEYAKFGRVLTIDDEIKFDAGPGKALPDKLEEIEAFIDTVLVALARL